MLPLASPSLRNRSTNGWLNRVVAIRFSSAFRAAPEAAVRTNTV